MVTTQRADVELTNSNDVVGCGTDGSNGVAVQFDSGVRMKFVPVRVRVCVAPRENQCAKLDVRAGNEPAPHETKCIVSEVKDYKCVKCMRTLTVNACSRFPASMWLDSIVCASQRDSHAGTGQANDELLTTVPPIHCVVSSQQPALPVCTSDVMPVRVMVEGVCSLTLVGV